MLRVNCWSSLCRIWNLLKVRLNFSAISWCYGCMWIFDTTAKFRDFLKYSGLNPIFSSQL